MADPDDRTRRVEALALGDLSSLQASIQEVKRSQFNMFLAALSMALAAAGLYFRIYAASLRSDAGREYSLWLAIAAVAPSVISLLVVTTYVAHTRAIRRRSAFSLILQQCLAAGSFPQNYRGFEDAYAFYVRASRDGDDRYRATLPKRRSLRSWLRTLNPFVRVSLLFYAGLLAVPSAISITHLYAYKPDLRGSFIFGMVFALIVFASWRYVTWLIRLVSGLESFEIVVLRFRRLLELENRPFDPVLELGSSQED